MNAPSSVGAAAVLVTVDDWTMATPVMGRPFVPVPAPVPAPIDVEWVTLAQVPPPDAAVAAPGPKAAVPAEAEPVQAVPIAASPPEPVPMERTQPSTQRAPEAAPELDAALPPAGLSRWAPLALASALALACGALAWHSRAARVYVAPPPVAATVAPAPRGAAPAPPPAPPGAVPAPLQAPPGAVPAPPGAAPAPLQAPPGAAPAPSAPPPAAAPRAEHSAASRLSTQLASAQLLLDSRRPEEARLIYQELLKRDDSARVRLGLALCAASTEHFQEAAVQYQRALHLRPGFAPALFGLARVYERRGDYDKALSTYRQYPERNAAAPRAHLVQRRIAALEARLATASRGTGGVP